MAREKKPSWWKMFANRRDIIDSIPDEDVGSGLKAAFAYFDDEEVNESELSQLAKIVFNGAFRPYIDEAKKDYADSVENGKRGAAIKNGRKI